MNNDAAKTLFDSIRTFIDLRRLIDDGETEGLYLECKSPSSPSINSGLSLKLSQSMSAFCNTQGGILIWGVSTDRHAHSNLDTLTQLEPIGNIKSFVRQLDAKMPSLTVPGLTNFTTKIVFERASDTKGVAITLIPKSHSPVQAKDSIFYFRSGEGVTIAPYDVIRMLFASASNPELHAEIQTHSLKRMEDGFDIPLSLVNSSLAPAEQAQISVKILNFENVESVTCDGLTDVSHLNDKMKIYSSEVTRPIYKGLGLRLGSFKVKMKPRKRKLSLECHIFAKGMIPKREHVDIQMVKNPRVVTKLSDLD